MSEIHNERKRTLHKNRQKCFVYTLISSFERKFPGNDQVRIRGVFSHSTNRLAVESRLQFTTTLLLTVGDFKFG